MSRIIKCQVNDEYLLGSGVVIGAAGSHGDVILQLQFNDMWEGLSIMATFRDAMNENPVAIMLMPSMLVIGETRTYEVHVPAEAKRIAGRARLTLSGYSVYTINDDGAITPNVDSLTNTATAFFRVLESDSTIADDGSITPTIAQQLHTEINNLDDAIDRLGNRLDEAVDDTLITQYTLEPPGPINTITAGYTNSFGVSCFNRPPVEGDIFYCLGRTTVEHIPFAMTARITGFSAEGENAVFEAIEVVPLVPANISTGQGTNSIVAPGCTADGEKSVALGNGSRASAYAQMVCGTYNAEDPDAQFIVGCGTSNTDRRNAFVVKVDGTAYAGDKKVLVEDDIGNIDAALDNILTIQTILLGATLTGTTWYFNEAITSPLVKKNVFFTSVTTEYIGIDFTGTFTALVGHYWFADDVGYAFPYNDHDGGWGYEPHRTITITGGEDANNPEFIAWLKQNATQIGGESV